LDGLPAEGSVLLLGSGLTSLDLTAALKAKGFKGQIHILSRHGLVPQSHRAANAWPEFWAQPWPLTVRGWTRLVRKEVKRASGVGCDWRAVIDALRPVTQTIWRRLPVEERKRFLRHVRSYWEVHRHRAAPEMADMVADLIHDGQVRIYAGTAREYVEHEDLAEVVFWDRKRHTLETLRVNRAINCTGSETDCRRIDDSLISNIFLQGFARPDPLFMGVDVGKNGALLDARGRPSHSLFAIGPPRKGSLWENTAVPEIRTQAAQLAEHLLYIWLRRPHARRLSSVPGGTKSSMPKPLAI
jgi:uncharacterized NAD(P)/FAD-binding protein YdhS